VLLRGSRGSESGHVQDVLSCTAGLAQADAPTGSILDHEPGTLEPNQTQRMVTFRRNGGFPGRGEAQAATKLLNRTPEPMQDQRVGCGSQPPHRCMGGTRLALGRR
jgi:hypothetical protein